MKKIILGVCAVAAIAAASCDKNAANTESAVSPELTDSISMVYGRNVGYYLQSNFDGFQAHNPEQVSKDGIVKGIQTVLAYADDASTLAGIQIGAQIAQQLNQLKQDGVDVDKAKFLNNLKQAFLLDSVDSTILRENGTLLMSLMKKAEDAVKGQSNDAVQNGLAGKAFVDNAKKNDPEIQTTESGLSYKVIEPGEGEHPTRGDFVVVNYTGKLTDGKVFDQGEGAEFEMARVVQGFSEGLSKIGKGGKAVLYIPGDLAYGPDGVPQAGIGPNQTLVFEVELVDINPEPDFE